MTSKIAPNSVCKIIAPAHPASQGRSVTVLRLAVGQSDIDGAAFIHESSGQAVWIVKALSAPIPWGSGAVNVFAIAEECLQIFIEPDAVPQTQVEVELRDPALVTA